MTEKKQDFPYFLSTPLRQLTLVERAVVEKLVSALDEKYKIQVPHVVVVGRCGCGQCPTIFFQPVGAGERESDLVSYAGSNDLGGLVAAVLLEKNEVLSQLEFYSIDGHSPWDIPDIQTLEPYR